MKIILFYFSCSILNYINAIVISYLLYVIVLGLGLNIVLFRKL